MIVAGLLCAAAVLGHPAPFVVRNATVFDGTCLRRGQDLLVENGVIAAVGRHLSVPGGAALVEGSGRTLLPGLIDAHVHVLKPDDLRTALAFGVTTELDMFTSHALAAA